VDGAPLGALGAGTVRRLYLGAKAPLPGKVKTRLGATIGDPAAAELYAAFLADLTARFAGAPFEVAWYAAPGARRHLAPYLAGAAAVRVQRGRDWAARQAALFRDCEEAGEGPVALIATDSPQLSTARVVEAFAALEAHDAVFGPTPDGGYYLVGMRGAHDLFTGVAMSTASALDQALERARRLGLSVALLAPEYDVDTADDLTQLAAEAGARDDLVATAATLARLAARGIAA
jgi:rSAM/selenodomain-associated transferase 1